MLLVQYTIIVLLAPCTLASPYVNISGDIMLVGFFPIHANGKGVTECGILQVDEGLQMLEAMLFTVDKINAENKLLPGIKLGVLAYDTCDSPAYALEQSLGVIKGFIAHYNANQSASQEFVCDDGTLPKYRGGRQVVALIGEQSSSVTMQIATVLRLFGTPIVSYLATSPALSNRDKFPSFFRTVSSDENQARAMLELIRKFNWTYVSIVYSDTEYGNQGYETLQRLAPNYGVCFATPLRLHSQYAPDSDYDGMVKRLARNTNSRVVIVFAEKPAVVLRLVESTLRLKENERFVWIGSHGWIVNEHQENHILNQSSTHLERREVLEGALAIQPLTGSLNNFIDYFTNLTLENHAEKNPWFEEYVNVVFNCNTTRKLAFYDTNDCKLLSYKTAVKKDFQPYPFLHFVKDAVYAVANALHQMHQVKCKGRPRLCPNMDKIENSEVVHYLRNVTFNDEEGKPFKFMDGDGPPRYSILNYQRRTENVFQWENVGSYLLDNEGKPKLTLNESKIIYRKGMKEFPPSKCSQNKSCGPLEIKIRENEDICCWSCVNCSIYEIRKNDSQRCAECKRGFLPSLNKSSCEQIRADFITYRHPWAGPALFAATLGIPLTIFVFFVFWKNAETPVVKASGRELSYILLIGTFVEFFMTYLILAPPTFLTCIATRFFLGFSFTLCYAAIVTKTNRIARIFKSGSQSYRTRFTSPLSQISITAVLTSVEIFIIVGWFWYDPPQVDYIYPTRESRLKICTGLGNNMSYLISLFYPFILIGVCTVYAFLTRKCPDGFNEARHIGFTNYTAIVIWLAFVPLYIASTNHNIRMVTLAMSLSLSGFVQLSCLFLPKIYIILFTPEKNTKEVVMGHHHTSSQPANSTSNNIPKNLNRK